MKNGQDAVLEPIRAIPFVFSISSFLANGFSTLRLFGSYRNSRHKRDLLATSPALRPWSGSHVARPKAADLKDRSAACIYLLSAYVYGDDPWLDSTLRTSGRVSFAMSTRQQIGFRAALT